jgi:hypothetical protein
MELLRERRIGLLRPEPFDMLLRERGMTLLGPQAFDMLYRSGVDPSGVTGDLSDGAIALPRSRCGASGHRQDRVTLPRSPLVASSASLSRKRPFPFLVKCSANPTCQGAWSLVVTRRYSNTAGDDRAPAASVQFGLVSSGHIGRELPQEGAADAEAEAGGRRGTATRVDGAAAGS